MDSNAAIETADVVIQTDQPSKVAEAIKVGKLTRRIIWQNVDVYKRQTAHAQQKKRLMQRFRYSMNMGK